MKLVFCDAEFTGEHAHTTLVSLGLVDIDGNELYLRLSDFDETQVTPWLRENVLSMIPVESRIPSHAAYAKLGQWMETLSGGERIHLVSAGKGADIILLFELYKHAFPSLERFHALHCLPPYLNHTQHFDLNTLFFACGVDSDQARESYLGRSVSPSRHDALYDAKVVRECFLKLLDHPAMERFARALGR
ncbi:hypothetical protein ACTZWW_10440 [Salinarimonas sp. NSM]|uniref:hypothetical protein n=1 Tax=Salinarimonas sp. NSM TaxID=3458003 RepID=UPI0040372A5F